MKLSQPLSQRAALNPALRSLALFLIAFLASDLRVFSASGYLDPSFGGTGQVKVDFGGGKGFAEDVAIQTDGKIVVVGNADSGFALARYHPDGTLDLSFNSTGNVTTPVGTNGAAYSVAIQTDGKIVAAGRTGLTGNFDFALARYNPDGSLDSSFNGSGIVTTSIGSGEEAAYDVAVQPDGKIIAVGYTQRDFTDDFALVRYNSDGTLDSSFNGNGKVITEMSDYWDRKYSDSANKVIVQPDGKIIAIGESQYETIAWATVARYLPNGSLDPSFSSDGKEYVLGTQGTGGATAALQPDGKIVIGAYTRPRFVNETSFGIARLNPDGSYDETFHATSISFGYGTLKNAYAYDVIIQRDGKIIQIGNEYGVSPTDWGLVIARFNPDGRLDTSFKGSGQVVLPQTGGYAATFQSDGKLVIVASSILRFFAELPVKEQSVPITTESFVVAPVAGEQEEFINNGHDITASLLSSIGAKGAGLLMQTGGTHTTPVLSIGSDSGSVGSYILQGGKISSGTIDIASNGSGYFSQEPDTVITNGGALTIGRNPGSIGTHRMGGGSITSGSIIVGHEGSGSVEQIAGSISAANCSIADAIGATGSYTMRGGSLAMTGDLLIGGPSGSTAALRVEGGNLTAGNVVISQNGGATLSISGGSLTLGRLESLSGQSTLTMARGELRVANTDIDAGSAGLVIGDQSTSTFVLRLQPGNHNVRNGIHVKSKSELQLEGGLVAPALTVALEGGTLTGSGTIGALTGYGTIDPGGTTTATLRVESASPGVLAGSYAYSVDAEATGSDQIITNRPINLSASSFGLRLRFVPTGESFFTIIQNDSSDPIQGTFGGKGEREIFSVNDPSGTPRYCYLTYTGGTGNDVVLRVNIPLPTVVTSETIIHSQSSATLNGLTNPNGQPTEAYFKYGGGFQSSAAGQDVIGTMTLIQEIGAGETSVPVSAVVEGLIPGKLYYVQLVARSPDGLVRGNVGTFRAGGEVPGISYLAPQKITASTTLLRGRVYTNGLAAVARFEYFKTMGGGQHLFSADFDVSPGSTFEEISYELSGLESGVHYSYRVVATNAAGTSTSPIFATSLDPAVTGPATSTGIGTTLTGIVNPNGLVAAPVYFEYGLDSTYGSKVAVASPLQGSSPLTVAASIPFASLTPGSTYHYRLVATAGGTVTAGADATFQAFVPPPVVTAVSASSGIAGVTFRGTVNPKGAATTELYFEYGPTYSLGSRVEVPGSLSGTSPIQVSAFIPASQFVAGQPGYLRLIATTAAGTSASPLGIFPVRKPPSVTTKAATDVSPTGATLNGTVIANGSGGTVTFELANTKEMLELNQPLITVPATPSIVSDQSSPQPVTARFTVPPDSPTPLDTVYFRLKVTDDTQGSVVSLALPVRLSGDSSIPAGEYAGMVGIGSASVNENGLLDLNLTQSGSFTGVLQWQGERYRLRNHLAPGGTFVEEISHKTSRSTPLRLELFTQSADKKILGTLTHGEITAVVELDAIGMAPNGLPPEKMRFLSAITPQTAEGATPGGDLAPLFGADGFVSIKVGKGPSRRATIIGRMPDGEPFSVSRPYARRYAMVSDLYKRRQMFTRKPIFLGQMKGDAVFDSGADQHSPRITAAFTWVKNPEPPGETAYYATGFTGVNATIDARPYSAIAHTFPIATGNDPRADLIIALSNGNLFPITKSARIRAGSRIDVTEKSNGADGIGRSLRLAVKVNKKAGVFSGSFNHPILQRKIRFEGAFDQMLNIGAGVFAGETMSGAVEIRGYTPVP